MIFDPYVPYGDHPVGASVGMIPILFSSPTKAFNYIKENIEEWNRYRREDGKWVLEHGEEPNEDCEDRIVYIKNSDIQVYIERQIIY